jgi:SM-20-related protein
MNFEGLILSLIERGWFTSESFINPALCQELLKEAQDLPYKEAKIGKGLLEQRTPDLRNDSLYWLDENSESQAQREYLKEIDLLKDSLNRELYLGLKQFEGHFAKYGQLGFYKKHLDQFQNNNERLVTAITYLNTPSSGGELIIYSRDNHNLIEAQILPEMGRFVCFLSQQIYHEVRPTQSERYSIAGWLRTTIL